MATLFRSLFLHQPIKSKTTRALCRAVSHFSALVERKKVRSSSSLSCGQFCASMDNKTNEIKCYNVNYQWCPEDLITQFKEGDCYACIVLNRRITIPPSIAQNIWENASIRCTVDGGTNRWKDFLTNYCQGREMKVPDYITGDFDSITEETSKFFTDPSIKRVHTPNQNATDFTKSISVVRPLLEAMESERKYIIVFHDTSGRLDQIMANINTLFKVQSDTFNLFLLSGNSMTWLLHPGTHSIKIPKDLLENERWCSLIPVGKRACVTTRGLKWNLVNGILEFGGLVSTSNTYSSEWVEVESDTNLLWSMGLFNFEDD